MTLFRTALIATALLLPAAAQAQGPAQGPSAGHGAGHPHSHPAPAARHGGIVAEATGEHWVELVIAGDRLTAWVSDEHGTPIPSAQLGGKASVLAGGTREEVALSPGEANSLAGRLAAVPAAKVTAVLALTVGGKPSQVRFAAR